MHKLLRETFPLAILAGICISIGCVVNLRVGGVAGAVLFAFGLTTVVYYGLKLYTGTAGFIRRQGDWTMLCVVLLGNIVGCLLSAWMIAYAQPDCIEPASKILAGRLAKGPWACFLLAIGCGFIMTTAVGCRCSWACPSSSSAASPTPSPTPSISSSRQPTCFSRLMSSSSTSARCSATSSAATSTAGRFSSSPKKPEFGEKYDAVICHNCQIPTKILASLRIIPYICNQINNITMLVLQDCIEKLSAFKHDFGRQFGITKLGIFGSVARQENREDSDIDIVVEVEKPTLSLMYELKEMLKSIFNCEVDLVRFRPTLRPLFRSNILNDVVYV